ncbi:hypothetical protein G9A89_002019 [Geosiphon pyriformis]|nr:hypothetical protein G9A89_002019 [Geosiphon pyriformis]
MVMILEVLQRHPVSRLTICVQILLALVIEWVSSSDTYSVAYSYSGWYDALKFSARQLLGTIYAHGGLSDNESNLSDQSKIPSVFLQDSSKETIAQGNIKLGFGLTALAAVACVLGSAIPFLDSLFPYLSWFKEFRITTSKGFMAGSLALGAGILLNLSLGDLFPEAGNSFRESGWFDKKYSSIVATAIFILTVCLIFLAKRYLPKIFQHDHSHDSEIAVVLNESGPSPTSNNNGDEKQSKLELPENLAATQYDAARLRRLGLQITLALVIHNFPEGLALFTTTIASTRIGTVYAIALILHKLPEGLVISLPIYYATRSKWQAFLIAAAAGAISTMLGALCGYVVFVSYWNEGVSGILFSIVTGILLYTVLHGMLPLARSYDPENFYCTYFTFIGIFFFGIIPFIARQYYSCVITAKSLEKQKHHPSLSPFHKIAKENAMSTINIPIEMNVTTESTSKTCGFFRTTNCLTPWHLRVLWIRCWQKQKCEYVHFAWVVLEQMHCYSYLMTS